MHKGIEIDGKQIVYQITGKGRSVVLVHGFGEDSRIWKQQVNYLQDKYQIITPDLPGSGQSGIINDMSIEGLADAIYTILQSEKIEECVLIGHSMGGYITLAFAEKYPTLLKGFGLFHSTAYADSEEKKATRLKGIDFINKHGAFQFLKTSTPNLFSPTTKETQPSLIEEHLNSLAYFQNEALVAYYYAMINRPDRTKILKESKVPVLFILGVHDVAVPIQDGLQQCYLPSVSYVQLLEQSGHMGMYEEPEKSNQTLEEFLTIT